MGNETVKQLTNTLGTDAFMNVYRQVEGMDRNQAVAVANEFNGPVAPSSTKTKALQSIYSRHRKLMDFKE